VTHPQSSEAVKNPRNRHITPSEYDESPGVFNASKIPGASLITPLSHFLKVSAKWPRPLDALGADFIRYFPQSFIVVNGKEVGLWWLRVECCRFGVKQVSQKILNPEIVKYDSFCYY
jgi:hypothetical protein